MTVSNQFFRQRAIGAVIGSAVGDALGAPFEFGPPGQFSERFPQPVIGGIGEMIGGGGYGWAPGEFTDDTQMAIVQAESLLARDGVDGADLFERFRSWAGDAKDVGNQTSAVLRSGDPWERAAADHFRRNPDRGAGNGSLMRSTPTAVRFARATADETVEIAHTTSAITHGDPAAGWGTALHHLMIRAVLLGDDLFAALEEGLQRLPEDQERYRRMLAADWTPQEPEVPNGTVWGCLATAVWAVRRSSGFADAVTSAIDVGGDTDTVAAVAGGLAGAIHGIQAIPSRWTTYLHGHVTTADGPDTYRLTDLHALAARLSGGSVPPVASLVSPVGPTEILDGVHAADLARATTVPTDWAVVSLCRVEDRFHTHPVRREVYLVDQEGDINADIPSALTDIVASIEAFRAEGRPVVVHCHAGESRTGLALRAWLMERHGWDEPTATDYLAPRWPSLTTRNATFTEALRSWSAASG
jgi:ADP-ribosyl-[dinitrogen reductase] hydrolase